MSAPSISLEANEAYQAGGNGLPDPGEDLLLSLYYRNEGHADASGLYIELIPITPFLVSPDTQIMLPVLSPLGGDTLIMPVHVAVSCPQGYTVRALATVFSGIRPLRSDTDPLRWALHLWL
ncbi:MAG: hypothetical protein IH599_00475 [Bacteroidales bacterium]|nr:hypothetical protein [Bacteroidales bacterium]